MRLLLVMGLLTLLAVLGLQHRDELAALLKPAVRELSQTSVKPGVSSARKCVDGAGRVLYTTDAACPKGQREQAVKEGAVNVLALPTAPPPPASAASVAMPLERIDQAFKK